MESEHNVAPLSGDWNSCPQTLLEVSTAQLAASDVSWSHLGVIAMLHCCLIDLKVSCDLDHPSGSLMQFLVDPEVSHNSSSIWKSPATWIVNPGVSCNFLSIQKSPAIWCDHNIASSHRSGSLLQFGLLMRKSPAIWCDHNIALSHRSGSLLQFGSLIWKSPAIWMIDLEVSCNVDRQSGSLLQFLMLPC